ncbi:hypothetical protein AOQ73_05790 [Bradyrhizobium pachyrhizi]|uniref:hypothetical protein n=1 Tax=Bradyrhizobium pachyrhizi TaxID=280333 RepID=UPI000713A7C6|nr:hypothetical protein [Bradyrhizobium pachyrhizi]KRQ11919.1 hypothetical protein AOQ73_05790 [Bradyrhizobium pachyrhizi]
MSDGLFGYSNSGLQSAAAQANSAAQLEPRSEETLARMFREDLGVAIEPQALRMFIRHRFARLSPLAHRIHDGHR